MKATEVTQGEWRALMGNNPSGFPGCGDDCPVEQVTFQEALAYANALSRREGREPCYSLRFCSGTLGGGCAGRPLVGDSYDSCDGDYRCGR